MERTAPLPALPALPALPEVHDPTRERARTRIVTLVAINLLLIVLEGALRKWALPSAQKALFFIRDPFMLAAVWLGIRHGFLPRTLLGNAVLAMATAYVFLAGYQIIALGLNPLVAAFGWRNYFFYAFLALVMGAALRRADVLRMVRIALIMSALMAPLAYLQWQAPPSDWLNSQGDDAYVFTVAQGVVRATGTFTFTTGFVCFVGASLACVAAAAFTPGFPRWLVVCGGFGAVICLAVSGSRTAFVHAAITALAIMGRETLRPLAKQRVIMHAASVALIVAMAAAMVFALPKAMELMAERSETAAMHGDKGQRFLTSFTMGFDPRITDAAGPFGNGIGLGSGGGSSVASGKRTFLLAEEEFPRVVLESGVLFGMLYMLLRYLISLWLLASAIRCIRERDDAVPLMLASFSIVLLMIGQMTLQGSINGYGWFFAGLGLAAVASSPETEAGDA
jgi:hypothetical protein